MCTFGTHVRQVDNIQDDNEDYDAITKADIKSCIFRNINKLYCLICKTIKLLLSLYILRTFLSVCIVSVHFHFIIYPLANIPQKHGWRFLQSKYWHKHFYWRKFYTKKFCNKIWGLSTMLRNIRKWIWGNFDTKGRGINLWYNRFTMKKSTQFEQSIEMPLLRTEFDSIY